jgi:flagellar basal-body rod protein FlgG
MIDALSIASSGLTANQAWIDSISNNVANMQTVGYKKNQIHFRDLIQQVDTDGSNPSAQRAAVTGAGIQVTQSSLDLGAGPIRSTDNPLDLAIQGNGFFEVTMPSGGTAYTRAGRFQLNADGQLTSHEGQVLTADVRIPPDAQIVTILANGMVTAKIANSGETVNAGQIRLVRFGNPESLNRLGDGLYRPTTQSGDVVYAEPGTNGTGTLLQAHVEMSNVDMVDEMTSLVLAQRAYQLNARLLQASDQILETINNLRR